MVYKPLPSAIYFFLTCKCGCGHFWIEQRKFIWHEGESAPTDAEIAAARLPCDHCPTCGEAFPPKVCRECGSPGTRDTIDLGRHSVEDELKYVTEHDLVCENGHRQRFLGLVESRRFC